MISSRLSKSALVLAIIGIGTSGAALAARSAPSPVTALASQESEVLSLINHYENTRSWTTQFKSAIAAQNSAANKAVAALAPATKSTATTTTSPKNAAPEDKNFQVQSLQVKDDGLGDIGGSIRIKNLSSKSYTVSFTVTFFANANDSGTPLGSAQGSAQDVGPGQTVTEDLVSEDSMFSQSNFYYQFQVDAEY